MTEEERAPIRYMIRERGKVLSNHLVDGQSNTTYFTNNSVGKWILNTLGGEYANTINTYYINTDHIEPKAPTDYPLSHEFNDIGWVVMTNDLINTDRVQAYFKSSYYGSFNHSHADQNSFIIQAFGEKLAVKSGYYDNYHSVHDKAITRATFAHNSITIDGGNGQPSQTDDLMAKGDIIEFVTQMSFDSATGDATPAYKGALDKYIRHFIYIRPGVFVVIDDLDAKDDTKSSFEWWLNAEDNTLTQYNDNSALIENGNANLKANVIYPQNTTVTYNDYSIMLTGGSYLEKDGVYLIFADKSLTCAMGYGQLSMSLTEDAYVEIDTTTDYLKVNPKDSITDHKGRKADSAIGLEVDYDSIDYGDLPINAQKGNYMLLTEGSAINASGLVPEISASRDSFGKYSIVWKEADDIIYDILINGGGRNLEAGTYFQQENVSGNTVNMINEFLGIEGGLLIPIQSSVDSAREENNWMRAYYYGTGSISGFGYPAMKDKVNDWYEFTLNRSADIYVIASGNKPGFIDDTWQQLNFFGNAFLPMGATVSYDKVYVKHIDVEIGEPVTVSMKTQGIGKLGAQYFTVVKPVE